MKPDFDFTIVTATLNPGKDLHKTAGSIRMQLSQTIQWIVIDGLSSDGTVEEIRKNSDIIDYWESKSDHGIYDAFNRACAHIKSEWVIFLGAGDCLFDAQSLSRLKKELTDKQQAGPLFYGNCFFHGQRGQTTHQEREVPMGSWRGGRLRLPCHQAIVHHSSALRAVDPFDLAYNVSADAKLIMSVWSRFRQWPHYLDIDLVTVQAGGFSSSPVQWETLHTENLWLINEFNLRRPIHARLQFLWNKLKVLAYRLIGIHAIRLANIARFRY